MVIDKGGDLGLTARALPILRAYGLGDERSSRRAERNEPTMSFRTNEMTFQLALYSRFRLATGGMAARRWGNGGRSQVLTARSRALAPLPPQLRVSRLRPQKASRLALLARFGVAEECGPARAWRRAMPSSLKRFQVDWPSPATPAGASTVLLFSLYETGARC